MSLDLAYLFLAAYVLDLILGDPKAWPHPIRLIGRIVTYWERILYRPDVSAGILFWSAVMGSVLSMTLILLGTLSRMWAPLEAVALVYLAYACLATRSLHEESRPVEEALARDDLSRARQKLSLIVSRQTAHLDPMNLRRGAIESVAENMSDGVVAPIFYGLLLGVPGMILYKAVNTMDSMVGYKNEKYLAFGRLAARADDAANFLPARLTGLIVALAAWLLGLDGKEAGRVLRRDRRNAGSPNAGWPEAALAGALGIRLGGPSTYFGVIEDKPYIGDADHEIGGRDYARAIRLLYAVSMISAGAAFILMALTGAGPWGLIGLAV
ncbi:MAG: adenosylcobinamide-phosphate synthase CbiB [Proteobacteria bacterium]|nr:adenosylcobinamide-phosphate synthase CbiB [Pseudomonadota bacterium]